MQWAKKNIPPPAVFEIKSTRGNDYFEVRELKEHQRQSLLAAQYGVFTYKIPDVGNSYKPFDAVLLGNLRAYVVIQYPSEFAVIVPESIPAKGRLYVNDALAKATMRGTFSNKKPTRLSADRSSENGLPV